jgi:hypothetical protein
MKYATQFKADRLVYVSPFFPSTKSNVATKQKLAEAESAAKGDIAVLNRYQRAKQKKEEKAREKKTVETLLSEQETHENSAFLDKAAFISSKRKFKNGDEDEETSVQPPQVDPSSSNHVSETGHPRAAKEEAREQRDEDDRCFICGEGGVLQLCDFPDCPRVYHKVCTNYQLIDPATIYFSR